MSEVYANGMTIACKAAAGKTVAAMPDVCLSPPSPPAGPVPIPYPNTAMASDTTKGTKTVQIEGQEVMMKDSSTFKTSSGDEAATKSLGMGVVTHTIQGETSFVAWSMDVKFEGANVPRNLDLTLHNEQCSPANTPPWPYMDRVAMAAPITDCAQNVDAVKSSCSVKDGKVACPSSDGLSKEQYAIVIENDPCQRAARCMLSPKDPSKCCAPQTPHHLLPKAGFFSDKYGGKPMPGCKDYNQGKAPCVCCEGTNYAQATHGLLHDAQANYLASNFPGKTEVGFGAGVDSAAHAMAKVCPQCNPECIKGQLRAEHKKMGIDDSHKIRPITSQPKDISIFRQAFEALQQALSAVPNAAPV